MIFNFLNKKCVPNSHIITERKLVDNLRKRIQGFPPLKLSKSDANNIWIKHRNELRSFILKKNLRRFLEWDIIRNTMSVENSPYVNEEFEFLKSGPYWFSRYAKALIESPVGSPKVYKKYPQSSGNLIHQAFHIRQFEIKTGITIDKLNCIFEFGGGYGCMCRLVHNLGFRGKYIIFDSEEFGTLQEFYLKSSGIEVVDLNENSQFIKGVVCISDISKLKPLLTERGEDLFLATWSISETSVDFRNNFFSHFPNFKNYLIAYQKEFEEINNVSYFSSFVKKRNGSHWYNWEIPHLKDNFYCFGVENKV